MVGSADDICLPSRNIRPIKEAYQELKETTMEIGLKINKDKTLAMIQTRCKASKATQYKNSRQFPLFRIMYH
jgi:hypothetical protein